MLIIVLLHTFKLTDSGNLPEACHSLGYKTASGGEISDIYISPVGWRAGLCAILYLKKGAC